MTITTGPWKAYKASFGWSVRSSAGDRLAQELTEADARLIAAAPELLEALEQLGNACMLVTLAGKAQDRETFRKQLENAREIIARAVEVKS